MARSGTPFFPSHVNDSPFIDVARQIGNPFGFDCQYFRRQPSQDGVQCDYPFIGSCTTVGNIVGYLY
jgi:hypothetical protein